MQIKTKIVSGHTADSKPVKQEVSGTLILPPLVFPAQTFVKKSFITLGPDEGTGTRPSKFYIKFIRPPI